MCLSTPTLLFLVLIGNEICSSFMVLRWVLRSNMRIIRSNKHEMIALPVWRDCMWTQLLCSLPLTSPTWTICFCLFLYYCKSMKHNKDSNLWFEGMGLQIHKVSRMDEFGNCKHDTWARSTSGNIDHRRAVSETMYPRLTFSILYIAIVCL